MFVEVLRHDSKTFQTIQPHLYKILSQIKGIVKKQMQIL